jgi:broad specificity phosphatase PhoE
MDAVLPIVCLARHGETAWSITGQHTGHTDLPLTDQGERNARQLGQRLSGQTFGRVFASPLKRATRTCELAGFGARAEVDRLLVEWNYGKYEGRTSAEIRREHPDWELFRDGCAGGETPDDVSRRADRLIERIRASHDNVLLFSSGHFLRVLAARWVNGEASMGGNLVLRTASLSVLGYEHDLFHPVIRLWNDTQQFTSSQ